MSPVRILLFVCGWICCGAYFFGACAPGGTNLQEPGQEVVSDANPGTDVAASDAPSADTKPVEPVPLKVMTFNVLCSFCVKSEYDKWDVRVPYLQELFKRHDADLIGVQELFVTNPDGGEVTLMMAKHPVYEAIYYKAKDGEPFDYPDATIYYRRERFEAREHGFFWLSPTPDQPFSKGFADGGQLYRLVVWARLFDKKSNREFYFATTHFDNNSPSQEKSAPLSLERLGPMAQKLPMIFVGDYNSKPNSKAYKILVEGIDGQGFKFQNTFDLLGQGKWRAVSEQEPPPEYDPTQRIDHIFVAGAQFQVSDWVVDLYRYGDKKLYPSDHWALIATISY